MEFFANNIREGQFKQYGRNAQSPIKTLIQLYTNKSITTLETGETVLHFEYLIKRWCSTNVYSDFIAFEQMEGSSGSLYPNPNVTWNGSSEKVSIINLHPNQLVSDSDSDDDTIPELVSDSDDDTLNKNGSCPLGVEKQLQGLCMSRSLQKDENIEKDQKGGGESRGSDAVERRKLLNKIEQLKKKIEQQRIVGELLVNVA